MTGLVLATGLVCASALAAGPALSVAPGGTRLETQRAPRDVQLENGVTVRLASKSAGTFFSDHVVLEEGAARIQNFGRYEVAARQLQIATDDPAAQAVIRLQKGAIEVSSLQGDLRIKDGSMLTKVATGTRMSFQQSGAAPADQNQPAQTGAAPAKRGPSDKKTLLWVIGITAAAALAIGITAAAQGKSPF